MPTSPKALSPMMAVSASRLPDGVEWSYEVKWDGYRAQAVKNDSAVSLASRNLKNITRQFPQVARVAALVRAKSAVLDGEIVALGPDGHPSFQALHHADTEGLSIVYYAFDLLHLNGKDLTSVPLDERRAALRAVIEGSGVLLSDPLPGTPPQIADAVRRLGLEGVVAKRRRSTYAAGRRSDAWVKVRFAQHCTGLTQRSTFISSAVIPSPQVVEVSFAEWTRDGSLRHAAFVALRDDKPAKDITREVSA